MSVTYKYHKRLNKLYIVWSVKYNYFEETMILTHDMEDITSKVNIKNILKMPSVDIVCKLKLKVNK